MMRNSIKKNKIFIAIIILILVLVWRSNIFYLNPEGFTVESDMAFLDLNKSYYPDKPTTFFTDNPIISDKGYLGVLSGSKFCKNNTMKVLRKESPQYDKCSSHKDTINQMFMVDTHRLVNNLRKECENKITEFESDISDKLEPRLDKLIEEYKSVQDDIKYLNTVLDKNSDTLSMYKKNGKSIDVKLENTKMTKDQGMQETLEYRKNYVDILEKRKKIKKYIRWSLIATAVIILIGLMKKRVIYNQNSGIISSDN